MVDACQLFSSCFCDEDVVGAKVPKEKVECIFCRGQIAWLRSPLYSRCWHSIV